MNKVYIVILNYKTWEDTIECIESVFKSNYENYHIIIVDNASLNNSLTKIANWLDGTQQFLVKPSNDLKQYVFPLEEKPLKFNLIGEDNLINQNKNKITLIQANENGGFSAGNNIGIKYALQDNDCEYIWLLNNDTVVKKDTLSMLVDSYRLLNKNNKIGIIGSKLLFYYKPDTLQAIGGKFNKYTAYFGEIGKNKKNNISENLEYSTTSYAVGASMMASRQFIEDVGLLYEGYFLYYEEIDWSVRGLQKNYETCICQASIVYHKEGGSTKLKNKKNLEIEYFKYKNLLTFYKRFYKYLMPIAYFRLTIKMIKKAFQGYFDEAYLILKVILKINDK